MAKRKTEKVAPAVASAGTAPSSAPEAPKSWWPAEFLAPRPTAIIVVAGIISSVVIAFLAVNNGLVGFKQFIAYLLGLTNPYDVGLAPNSADAGAVLLGLIWTLIGAAIHPAVGLAVLMLLRPWLDGFTFPTDNTYFVWGTMLCFVVWGVRVVMRGDAVRAWRPTLLFALFPLVAWLLAGQSINYNDTYRALVNFPTYVILFFLVANLGASPALFRFLVGAVVLSVTAEAVFAVMQYRYILPFLRSLIQSDPTILGNQFGVDTPTAELARRFNINRAFGTVLFPNALAAFLILWIPLFAAGAWNNLLAWRAASARPEKRKTTAKDRYNAVGLAVFVWFFGVLVIYALMQFPVAYVPADQLSSLNGPVASVLVSSGLALLPAAGLFLIASGRGVAHALTVARTALYALSLLFSVYTLLLTFSRGGMLGLGAAVVLVAPLVLFPRARLAAMLPAVLRRGLALSAVLGLAMFLIAQAPAPEAAPNTGAVPTQAAPTPSAPSPSAATSPVTTITTAGQNVTGEDLVSGASFRARFTYWRVGWRMFLDNPWSGVGLRCFQWAYPKYQYIGAHDVREAHNSFLQAFCETGIVGGIAMLAFWAYVVIAGLRRTLGEDDSTRKYLYAALTAGILAFLLHAVIDINFSHPTLMFFIAIAAGLIFALDRAPEAPARTAHLAVLPALVIAALVSGMGLRVYSQDLAMGRVSLIAVADYDKKSQSEMENRLNVGRYFLETVPEKARTKERPPSIYFASARLFIPDVKVLGNLGPLVAKAPSGNFEQVRIGQEIPPDALLVVNKPWAARKLALEYGVKVVAEAEMIDARFPYNPSIAAYLSEWYEALARCTDTDRTRADNQKYLERMMYWSEVAAARNPWHAGLQQTLAMKHWRRAEYIRDRDNREEFEKSWEILKNAVALAPATPAYYGPLGWTGKVLAEAYEKAGLKEKAAEFREQGELFSRRTGELVTKRIQLGVEPAPPPAGPVGQPPKGARKQ